MPYKYNLCATSLSMDARQVMERAVCWLIIKHEEEHEVFLYALYPTIELWLQQKAELTPT